VKAGLYHFHPDRAPNRSAIFLLNVSLDANYGRGAAETWDWQAAVHRANQPRLWTDA
jgi:hypothetical protein